VTGAASVRGGASSVYGGVDTNCTATEDTTLVIRDEVDVEGVAASIDDKGGVAAIEIDAAADLTRS
jgi:hypothetical protein